MKYKVLSRFADLKDVNEGVTKVYEAGDSYPREGFEVDEKRLQELSSEKNKLGKALIALVEAEEEAEDNAAEANVEVVEAKKTVAKKSPAKK